MATTISVNVTVDEAAVKRAVTRAAQPTLVRRADDAAQYAVAQANSKMGADFDLNRPYERRRYPGSRRAATALDFYVETREDGVSWGFRVLGGDDVLKKIIFLNYGTRPHRIYPSGAWPLRGIRGGGGVRFGARPRGGAGQPMLAWTDENGSVVTPEVDHPGQEGTGFIEAALEESLSRFVS